MRITLHSQAHKIVLSFLLGGAISCKFPIAKDSKTKILDSNQIPDGKFKKGPSRIWLVSPSTDQTKLSSGGKRFRIYDTIDPNTDLDIGTTENHSYFPKNMFNQLSDYSLFWSFSGTESFKYIQKDTTVTGDIINRSIPEWKYSSEGGSLSGLFPMPFLKDFPDDIEWKYQFSHEIEITTTKPARIQIARTFLNLTCYKYNQSPDGKLIPLTLDSKILSSHHRFSTLDGTQSPSTSAHNISHVFSSDQFNDFKSSCDGNMGTVFGDLTFRLEVPNDQTVHFFGINTTLSDLGTTGNSTFPIKVSTAIKSDDLEVWNAKEHCKDNGGSYWLCESLHVKVPIDRVSLTENKFLQSILYNNTLRYQYQCDKVTYVGDPIPRDQSLSVRLGSQLQHQSYDDNRQQ